MSNRERDIALREALQRYGEEVSTGKRGARWELARLSALAREPMALRQLTALGGPDWAAWRDDRLSAVSPGSVLREWNLFSHVYSVAIREWGWARDALWRKGRDRAGVTGLRWHDSRALAITRLADTLAPLALARMVGHRNLKQLLTYYRESEESIADRISGA